MSLPTIYLRKANSIKSFRKLFFLHSFLRDNPNDEAEQKIINLERCIFVLSGILSESEFPLEDIDTDELKSYIQSNLSLDNVYRSLLYTISHIGGFA